MKKLFSLLLCVVMVLSLVACGSKTDDAQTPDEPQDTAPELSGTMKVVATGDVYGPLFDAFTADTGVEVECLSMSSGEVLSKLRAEGGTPSADLWFGGGIDAFMSAKDDGLLEPVTFDAAAELGDEYKDTEGYWYSKGITIVGFLLNNSLMEELGLTAPESWDDLTDSQYEGEIVMSNPAVSGTNYAVVNALLQAKGDQGWDYFDALNSNIAYYGKRGSDPKNKVSSGEFAVGISYIDASIEQAAEENDLTIVYPSDGMPWVPEGVAVFKNAENVDAAKYFVEWLFSSDDHLRQLADARVLALGKADETQVPAALFLCLRAGRLAVLRDVVFPALRPAFLSCFVYNFTSSMTTAGSIIFLIDAKRQLAVFKLFDAVYQGDYALASLIASVITVIVLLVEGLAFLITRKGENRRVSRT